MKLEGDSKEKYLSALEKSLISLSNGMGVDKTLERSHYQHIANATTRLANDIHFLRFIDSDPDFHNNFGIYPTIMLGANGFPDPFDFTKLAGDKLAAKAKIESTPPIANIQARLKDSLEKGDVSQISKIRNDYRRQTFYAKLIDHPLLAIDTLQNNMTATSIGHDRYVVEYSGLNRSRNIWTVMTLDVESVPYMKKRAFQRSIEVNNLYPDSSDNNKIHISENLLNLIQPTISSNVDYLFMVLSDNNGSIKGLIPKKVSKFEIGAFYSPQLQNNNEGLDKIFMKHPESYMLLGRRGYLASLGEVGEGEERRSTFSTLDIKYDEFIVIPTVLKQFDSKLIEMVKMKNNVHLYEV